MRGWWRLRDPTSCQAQTPVFTLLGKRWTSLIIGTLLHGPTRFAEICRLIPGVSESMVSGRLNELMGAGLASGGFSVARRSVSSTASRRVGRRCGRRSTSSGGGRRNTCHINSRSHQ